MRDLSGMRIVVYESFEALPEAFVDANSYPEQQNFLISNNWFFNLYETALEGELSLRIYVAFDDVGVALGALYCGVLHGTKQLVSLTNYYSLDFSPVVFGDARENENTIDALVAYLANEKPRWSGVDFRFLLLERPECQALMESLKRWGFFVDSFFQYENWYTTIENTSFDQYYGKRKSQLKNTIKRKSKKLDKEFSVDIKLYSETGSELDRGIDDYVAVYNRSWKRVEPHPDFSPGLIRLCASLDTLILGVIYLNEKPVASQLWFKVGDAYVIYKLAYDEEYKKMSAGSVLSKYMFESVIDEGSSRLIDYGIGSEPYKKDWMDEFHVISGVSGHNLKSIKGIGLALTTIFKSKLKSIISVRKNTKG